ncbi:MAG: DNA-3-methyladenine glycosylase 2 family protein [Clostridia bacterium]|nr:DNA-3-methyladenine glycosylase 2 family protein [Clostridia bacterium]
MTPVTFSVTQLNIDGLSALRLDGVELFDVGRIFDCGQCFRFDPVSNSLHEIEYAGCAYGKYVSIAQDGSTVYIYNATLDEYESVWKKFLSLDRNYAEINQSILSLSDNPALSDAVSLASGIRILKQEEWESICSFIISQNNNIPRIKKLVAALCAACGEKIDVSGMQGHVADLHRNDDMTVYAFPAPDKVAALGIDGLSALKVGFRAKYIMDAATKFSAAEIDTLLLSTHESTDECVKHLCAVKGIGPKVASCALLFGFARLDAFPVDVWIKKVVSKYFDEGFDPRALGQYAGIAQQYLFYYERYLVSADKGDKNED